MTKKPVQYIIITALLYLQVKIWFQNRRSKYKKIMKQGPGSGVSLPPLDNENMGDSPDEDEDAPSPGAEGDCVDDQQLDQRPGSVKQEQNHSANHTPIPQQQQPGQQQPPQSQPQQPQQPQPVQALPPQIDLNSGNMAAASSAIQQPIHAQQQQMNNNSTSPSALHQPIPTSYHDPQSMYNMTYNMINTSHGYIPPQYSNWYGQTSTQPHGQQQLLT